MVNRKKLSVLVVVCGLVALSSCSIGLDPAKDTQTSVALHLNQLSLPDGSTAGRAVIQGSGSLFIRTVGGPTGTLGPLYGPYPVSAGGTFETTDIPAGTYSKIAILFCAYADPAKTVMYNSSPHTLIELLSLDDTLFTALIAAATPIDDIIDGSGSQKVLDNVQLKAGVRNTLNITMMPIVSSVSSVADVSAGPYNLPASTSAMNHKFIQLTNLASMLTANCKMSQLKVNFSPAGSTTVGAVALYDASGALVPNSVNASLGIISASNLYTFNYTTTAPCYMYIEYQGAAPQLSFDKNEVPIPFHTISFDANGGTGTMANQSLFENTSQALNPNGFTKASSVFAGWSLASNGSVAYLDGALFPMGISNVTLYAKWTPVSATKDITAFSIITPAATGVITGQNIAITVPNGTDVTALQASFVTTGVSVTISGITQASGTTVNNFTGMVTYTVTAMDSSTQNYYVTVTVLPSTDASLSDLLPVAFTMNETFLPATLAYTSNANSANTLVMVRPTSSSPAAKIEAKVNSGGYAIVTSGSTSPSMILDSVTGINIISVRVTAQDNVTIKTYTITVNKTVLVDINTVGGGTLTPMGSMERTPGSIVSLVATPTAGYRFVNWTGATVASPTSASTTLTVPASNITLLANFTPDFAAGDGSVGAPYQITTLAHLKNVNNFLTPAYYFKVMAPIDLSSEPNWTPLGNSTTKFIGNFDGNNMVISNMKINSGASEVGLFGVTSNTTIQNVQLTNINISAGWDFVGGLVGNTTGTSTITRCSVSGVINAHQGIGGLIGNNDSGQTLNIFRCSADVDIATAYTSVGALGGLVGCTYEGSIFESFATGDVGPHGGTPNGVGGLIGSNMNSTVADSYATGSVFGVDSVGGLIGNNSSSLAIDRCYSVGLVTATGSNPGGLSASGTVTDCYYDMDTAGLSVGVGNATITGDMMMSVTFSGWDFITVPVWKIAASEYPKLNWQP